MVDQRAACRGRFDTAILGDISVRFYPAGIQLYAMLFGLLAVILLACLLLRPAAVARARPAACASSASPRSCSCVWVLGSIAVQDRRPDQPQRGRLGRAGRRRAHHPGRPRCSPDVDIDVPERGPGCAAALEILIIVVLMARAAVRRRLHARTSRTASSSRRSWSPSSAWSGGLLGTGFGGYLGFVAAQQPPPAAARRRSLVAFLFPFTQNGSDANMSIATQILIFAATALGPEHRRRPRRPARPRLHRLPRRRRLRRPPCCRTRRSPPSAGTRRSSSSMLIGAAAAATFGLIIGTPTLRVSGDYLAIVTLGFGEIFRLAMINLDGNNGPDLTNGPNGIPGDPRPRALRLRLRRRRTPSPASRSAGSRNYYFLLLLLLMFVILVFTRLNDSRIGRGWVAIREDERAAEAMGVNVFGLKLLAFAVGAFLAGLAGTVKAHQDTSVSPDQYVFLESAFLLAAVVLGGMGTVTGVLVGATILKLLPEKLRVRHGLPAAAVRRCCSSLMMRFRPEGLVAEQAPPARVPRRGHRARRARPGRAPPGGEMTVTDDPGRRGPPRRRQLVLEASGVTMRFGGLTAVDDVEHEGARGRDRRPDRPQRRRQDHLLQLPHRPVHPDRGPGHAQRRRPCRRSRSRWSPGRHGPHLPEHPAVRAT